MTNPVHREVMWKHTLEWAQQGFTAADIGDGRCRCSKRVESMEEYVEHVLLAYYDEMRKLIGAVFGPLLQEEGEQDDDNGAA